MDDNRLRKHYLVYIIGAVLFTVALSATVTVQRHCSEMRETVDKLRTLSGSSVRVKKATQSAYDAVMRIRKEASSACLSGPAENLIFYTVDRIKEQTGKGEIAVESLQDAGDEMGLPITLKGSLEDYGEFLRMIGYLESLRFPFFSATELLMTQGTDGASSYEIRGSIRTLRRPVAVDDQAESAPKRRG